MYKDVASAKIKFRPTWHRFAPNPNILNLNSIMFVSILLHGHKAVSIMYLIINIFVDLTWDSILDHLISFCFEHRPLYYIDAWRSSDGVGGAAGRGLGVLVKRTVEVGSQEVHNCFIRRHHDRCIWYLPYELRAQTPVKIKFFIE